MGVFVIVGVALGSKVGVIVGVDRIVDIEQADKQKLITAKNIIFLIFILSIGNLSSGLYVLSHRVYIIPEMGKYKYSTACPLVIIDLSSYLTLLILLFLPKLVIPSPLPRKLGKSIGCFEVDLRLKTLIRRECNDINYKYSLRH